RKEAESKKQAFKYDRRCDRLPAEEVERRVAAGEPFVIRFRIPDGTTQWNDLVHETIAFPNKDLDDFVILRSNATPIYNLAVVSDDIAMGITLVMRGDDHISNTPKQILLYRALGADLPVFAHLPMIHGMDGKKLSKRHGATAVGDYQHQGLLPGAMLNFLALLGWSPGGDREIMTVNEMISLFDPAGLQRKAAIFDPQKLDWMNGQHLSRIPLEDLEPRVTPSMIAAGLIDADGIAARREWYLSLLDLLRVRARTMDDIVRQAGPYFLPTIEYDADAVAKVTVAHLIEMKSGISDFFGREFEATPKDRIRTLADYLPFFAKKPLAFEPGTGQAYSNGGYLTLGLIIEKVSGQNYYDYVRDHIFKPAGMTNTDAFELDSVVPNLAVGYTRRGGGLTSNLYSLPARGSSAGGGYSTAPDMLKYAEALVAHRLASPAYTAWSLGGPRPDPKTPAPPGPLRGGLGIAGGSPGVNAAFEVNAAQRLVIVILANDDPPAAEDLARKIRLGR
ncbi:MAG: glutamate--tRNA ligase family protein, partial [Vicinamibacteria bacterium]